MTKLRHVNIYHYWLKQEVQGRNVQVKYTKSTDMVVDGLTKALLAGKWNRFLYQLGIERIKERPQNRKQEGMEEGSKHGRLPMKCRLNRDLLEPEGVC